MDSMLNYLFCYLNSCVSVRNFMRYIKNAKRPYAESFHNPSRYDLTKDAKEWLVYFLSQNEAFLKKFKVDRHEKLKLVFLFTDHAINKEENNIF